MPSLESLSAFLFASLLLALVPGPDNLFVLTQGAMYGKAEGVFVTLGLCSGLIVHTCAVAFGVAALFQASVTAFTALKTIGALYLLFLAWQAFNAKESSQDKEERKENPLTPKSLYFRGVIMNVTNPKVSIFFLAFLPQFADPKNGPLAGQIFVLGFVFMSATFVVFGSIAFLAGVLGGYLRRSPGVRVFLNRLSGTVFVGLAIKLVTSNIDR